jgi:hypothetical protein
MARRNYYKVIATKGDERESIRCDTKTEAHSRQAEFRAAGWDRVIVQ